MTAATYPVPPYSNITISSTNPTIYGGGGTWYPNGGWIGGTAIGTASTSYYPWPPITPNEQLLNDTNVMDALIDKMATKADPDRDLVVCVDFDCSPEMQKEIAQRLSERGIRGMVIPGARAGYGAPIGINARDEDKRIDVLARIGELWEQRPDLKLTELFQWYAGADMQDEDFVRCTEVHFKKLTEM